jgi:alkylation response protein AidB-like acyl-CoA dehydrogenase
VIDLVESDDQAALASAAADLLQKTQDDSPERTWASAVDQGWLGIGVPESLGGVDLGLAEQVLLFRELGRYLSPLPVLESVLAITAATEAMPRDDHLVRLLVAGERRVRLAQVTRPGELMVWEHADPADLVLAVGQDFVSLVEPRHLRLGAQADTLDPLYRLRPAAWDGTGAMARGGPAAAAEVRMRALVLTAAQLAGIAAQVTDVSVAYAAQRVQYGRPIGAFQAVKHRCADMAVRAEAAWCITALAALEIQHDDESARADAHAARIVAADAALRNARDNIQNHGATGFTAELAAHRYLKRAHVLGAMLTTSAEARSALLAEDPPW